MLFVSPTTRAIAFRRPDGTLRVRGPDCEVDLTGGFAEDFLRAFLGEAPPGDLGRLGRLEALGRPAHRSLAAVARARDARRWEPLSAFTRSALLFLEVVGRCNERCLHCYAGSSPDVTAGLEREVCERVVDEGFALGFDCLQLTGGDPLLCAFLPELAARARRVGYRSIEVYTNGLALTPERLEALARSEVAFAFSVYSHDPAVHDRVTRVPGSHARTFSAIARAAARGLPVRVGVIAVEPGQAHLERTLEAVRALGVRNVSADQVRTVGRGDGLPAEPLAADAARPAHGAPASGPAAPTSPAAPRVRWPGKVCVAYTGQVLPCIFARSNVLGDVRREPLAAIVARAREARATAGVDPDLLADALACRECRLTSATLGGIP